MFYFADNKNSYLRFGYKLHAGGDGGGDGGGAAAGDAAAAAGIGAAGTIGGGGLSGEGSIGGAPGTGTGGVPSGADPVSSGDPTSQGFGGTVVGGSVGEGGQGIGDSASLGQAIGEAVLAGNMTADEANSALAGIGQQNSGLSGIIGLAAANTSAALASMPGALSTGLSVIGRPVTASLAFAGLAAAVTGQGMLGVGVDPGVGDQDGPSFEGLIAEGQQYALDNNIDMSQISGIQENQPTGSSSDNQPGLLSAPSFKVSSQDEPLATENSGILSAPQFRRT